MDIALLFKTIIGAGLIVVCLMELIKRQLKKAHERPAETLTDANKDQMKTFEPWHIPSWLGLLLGLVLSCIVSLLFFMAWLRPSSIWVYTIHTLIVFLFQYFVSMEVAKKILVFFSKREGIDITPIISTGGN